HLARGRAEALQAAQTSIKYDQFVSGVKHEDVLFERNVVGRQEVVSQLSTYLLLSEPGEDRMRIVERQRAVGYNRFLRAPKLETVEVRRLRISQRPLGESWRDGVSASNAGYCEGPAAPKQSTT